MKTTCLLALLALAGCASTGTQLQAACEAQHAQFKAVVQCTQSSIASQNPRILQDPRAKLYLLRGQELAADVEAGRISDVGARVAWQRMYLDFDTAARKDMAESIEQMTRKPARPAQVNCTSTKIFDTVRTTCD
jgi:hypothetical protein